MAVRTESKTINGYEYSVTQWNVELAMLNKFKLLKAFGASLTALATIDQKSNNESEMLAKSLTELFKNNDPKELMSLMKSCIVGVAREGTKITESKFIELYSADDIMEIYQVFVFVLQVNYSNFFKGQWAESLLTTMEKQ